MAGNSLTFSNINGAATTVVKSGGGWLQSITINTAAAAAITVYDNTEASGTKIATFQASAGVGTYHFTCNFKTGLTVVTAGATDITVCYE